MATTPMLFPDGSIRMVPSGPEVSRMQDAGGQIAHPVKTPDGKMRWVPTGDLGSVMMQGGIPGVYPRVPAGLHVPPEPQGDPVINDLLQMGKDTAKNIYQISTPGIAASLAEKLKPGITKDLPEALQPTPVTDLPTGPYGRNALSNQVAVNGLLTLSGALEPMPRNATVPQPAAAAGESAASGALSGVGMTVARHLPYVGKFVRAGEMAADLLKGKAEAPPTAPAPAVPPWWGKSNVGPVDQWGVPGGAVPKSAEAPALNPSESAPTAMDGSTIPRTLSGESVLSDALAELDNKTLLRAAKSRGINVSKESQLKPGVADSMLIRKIVEDFSPEELDNVRNVGLEVSRFSGSHDYATPALGKESWHNKILQTYFPDVAIPAASMKRVSAGVKGSPLYNALATKAGRK